MLRMYFDYTNTFPNFFGAHLWMGSKVRLFLNRSCALTLHTQCGIQEGAEHRQFGHFLTAFR